MLSQWGRVGAVVDHVYYVFVLRDTLRYMNRQQGMLSAQVFLFRFFPSAPHSVFETVYYTTDPFSLSLFDLSHYGTAPIAHPLLFARRRSFPPLFLQTRVYKDKRCYVV